MDHSNVKQTLCQKKIKIRVDCILPSFLTLPGFRKDVGKDRAKRIGTGEVREVVGRETIFT